MLKKFLSILASAIIVVSGASISPANAVTPFVTGDAIGYGALSADVNMTEANKIVIPAGQTWVNGTASVSLTNAWLVAHAGQKLTYTATLKDPSGNNVLAFDSMTSMNMPDAMAWEASASGYINSNGSGSCSSSYPDYQTKSLTIPANAANCIGGFGVQFTLTGNMATGDVDIPAGTYTIDYSIFSNGTAVDKTETGVTVQPTRASFSFTSSPSTAPVGTTSAYASATLCVDSAKVAVGDELVAEVWLDGVSKNNSGSWSTRSVLASKTDSAYRQGYLNQVSSAIVTQFDITYGLAVNIGTSINPVTAGNSYTWGFKLYNKTTSADVSGSCKPAKPATPTV
ncbi:MAG: hypothetical protein RLZZ400_403, partial [Actinomycetota bacterium]